MKKSILVITDGIGYNPKNYYNAFAAAKKRAYEYLFKNVPYSLIKTHGMSVGLPEGQMGNSEVGHMTIGSGRVLYQDLVRISISLKDGSFEKNEIFRNFLNKNKRVHIIGLLSDGGVHSHIDHFIKIANITSREKETFLHIITDGRDVFFKSAIKYIKELQNSAIEAKIASIGGRFYTMDRDKRWDRVERGYKAIVQATPK
ncbi:MAG TPA: phosphoglycerate mutase (2,3-diphosphoglycerate-independent), partial [Campylobacterales bacterium]|nr:phosphoglycerate mutase (2,3-diphosphoglycerate-independent) [Campylobacterales bacterium]